MDLNLRNVVAKRNGYSPAAKKNRKAKKQIDREGL